MLGREGATLARRGCLADNGRDTGSNGGKGILPLPFPVVSRSSSKGSSFGVGGRELSMVDVELIESFGPRDMTGARVGLG